MCGIWAFINGIHNYDVDELFSNFMKIKPRGPDFSSFQNYSNVMLGFHRLSIMDLSMASNQPYVVCDENRTIVFVCNGEIYSYKKLIKKYNLPIVSKSDCMTIPQLYLKLSYNNFLELFIEEIKGEFAFLLFEFDKSNNLNHIICGRDSIGIRPLYWSKPEVENQELVFSSEIKGCNFYDQKIEEFPPGNIMKFVYDNNKLSLPFEKFNFSSVYSIAERPPYINDDNLLRNINVSINNSINRRLDSDQPIGFLLSGGVDSSLIAALGAKLSNQKIKTFCCGMKGGSDFKYAKMVADYINSEHTEVIFTPEEGLAVIDEVIYTIETWDTTTIRASVGQYLVSKYIKENTNIKVLFVGEGPDEVCSSYLFNWYAPENDMEEIHNTAIDYVKNIHYYDVKRCDRCIAKWGLEARVALLDPEFIEAYWNIPSNERHPKTKGIEKWWLRKAFEDDKLLPSEVLWRKKEAFSDGVSSTEKSWFQIIQDHIYEKYNMSEKDYFKQKFIEYFGNKRLDIIPHYWQPKWDKNGNTIQEYVDPSARTLDIYNEN
jgi:asparagine synthase (glutamine-hydrolysing)